MVVVPAKLMDSREVPDGTGDEELAGDESLGVGSMV